MGTNSYTTAYLGHLRGYYHLPCNGLWRIRQNFRTAILVSGDLSIGSSSSTVSVKSSPSSGKASISVTLNTSRRSIVLAEVGYHPTSAHPQRQDGLYSVLSRYCTVLTLCSTHYLRSKFTLNVNPTLIHI